MCLIILDPTEFAFKIRLGKFSKNFKKGGIFFTFLPIEITGKKYSTRETALFCGFWGPRGLKSNQTKDFLNYKTNFLISSDKFIKKEGTKDFDETEFYDFGPLITINREEINTLCTIFYRITDPIKLTKAFGYKKEAYYYDRFKSSLAAKCSSALRSTVARLTLDELFEERQKLHELLIRELGEVANVWGIEVINVALEEMFLEDPRMQIMLDHKKQAEIIGQAERLKAEHEAEMITVEKHSKEERRKLIERAKEESLLIEQETNRLKSEIELEIIEIEKEGRILLEKSEAAGKVLVAKAEAERAKLINDLVDKKILKYELIEILPKIVEQISFNQDKIILIPSKKGLGPLTIPSLLSNLNTEYYEEEE
jgi:regulator of protease activity HflC (stomatin/prohibitin superfamily)